MSQAAVRDDEIRIMPVEHVLPGEPEAIDHMIDVLKEQLEKRYKQRPMKRDAHPKHHGLVKATFIVDPRRPPELRHGLFKNDDRFDAVIRYSNGQPEVGHDLAGDIRGLAIHLGTGKESLLHDEAHDFILATGEAFFGSNVPDYRDFPEASATLWGNVKYFGRRPRALWQLWKAFKRPASALLVEYFSQTPYRLGPHCVKHLVRPGPDGPSMADYPPYLKPLRRFLFGIAATIVGFVRKKWLHHIPGFDALKESLEIDLAEAPVTLEFLVQRWADLSTIPEWAIEDATRVWDLPWTRVATIVVHQQTDIRDRDELAEHMNFNVWRALPEHQPLGGINRARLAVYLTMSKFRNDFNEKKKPSTAAPLLADPPAPSSTAASRA